MHNRLYGIASAIAAILMVCSTAGAQAAVVVERAPSSDESSHRIDVIDASDDGFQDDAVYIRYADGSFEISDYQGISLEVRSWAEPEWLPPEMRPAPYVQRCEAVAPTMVRCAAGAPTLAVHTGDGEDTVTVDESVTQGWRIDAQLLAVEDDPTLYYEEGTGPKSFFGGSGGDTIDGGTDADRLSGRGGDDYVDGRAGADRVAGESGDDTIHMPGFGTENDPDAESNPVRTGVLDKYTSCGPGTDWAERNGLLMPGPDLRVARVPADCEGSSVLWRKDPVLSGDARVGQTLRVGKLHVEGGPHRRIRAEWTFCPPRARSVSTRCHEEGTRAPSFRLTERELGDRVRVQVWVDASLYGRYNREEHWSQVGATSDWTRPVKRAR